ncbi:UPF0182 family membrane protein [Glycomyces terrestris]|uniref:UPF0182 family protein n=1 Tax=Glycomyces terrestris TaxID=2493553 RepID=A0A426URV7_9ACTN|nr:UPF0182 family protein [Glycomyces terrestris]RRR95857.1 UPF0182 family protein [Glycomyces terrestris]
MSRRGRYVLILLVGAIVLLSVLGWLVSLRTDYLWYQSVGYTSVFSTMMWTRLGMFGVFTLAMAAWCGLNLYLAYRFRPDTWPATSEQEGLERYRELISPKAGWWIAGVAIVVGVFAGMSAQSRWETWLLFREGGQFDWTDPVLGMNAGFYVFRLPFWQFLIGFGFAAIVVGLLASLSAYYLYGALRFSGQGDRMTNVARIHLSVLVALFLGLKAVAYYFDRFDFTTQENQVTDIVGGGYTEMTALMNAKNALIWVSVIAAIVILVFSWGFTRSLALPAAALGLVVVTAIAAGGIYPAVVRNFQVEPNRPQREGEYAQHTIDGTRYAYGMEDLETTTYQVASQPDATQLADPDSLADPTAENPVVPNDDNPTIGNVRLIDPFVVSDAFTQAQQPRSFYDFNEKLDVDRYTYTDENGNEVTQDFVVGLRELNPSQLTDEQQDWTVAHTVYTHGWGFVSASTTESDNGAPCFTSGVLSDDPGACQISNDIIDVERPQIYYGLLNNEYAIVGVPEDETPREYDRPTDVTVSDEDDGDAPAEEIGDDRYTTYEGDGGVDIGSIGNRLLYAWEFQEPRFLLSDQINEESQLLYNRNIRERVQMVAPFLTVEADPYPAVVDGQIVWIVDGYTTTNDFPYSDRVNLADATNDTYSGQGVANQSSEEINYIRSSVKAVVNAYDGSVQLYEFDEEDPILQAWNTIYGGDLIIPKDETPEALEAHFRYPQDLFKIQRNLLQRYHVDESRTFIEGGEAWATPSDPSQTTEVTQPAYYVYATYPDQSGQAYFQLTSSFTPRNRPNALASLMSGYYDENGDPQLKVYDVVGGEDQSVRQIHQIITSTSEVVTTLRDATQAGTTVEWGNLLALPVGDGILYLEPMYLRRQAGGQGEDLPRLTNVAISYGGYVGFAPTFEEAVAMVVEKYVSGAPSEAEQTEGEEGETETPTETPSEAPTTEAPATADPPEVEAAIDNVIAAQEAYEAAQASGTNEEQGRALDDLLAALDQLAAAREAAGQ